MIVDDAPVSAHECAGSAVARQTRRPVSRTSSIRRAGILAWCYTFVGLGTVACNIAILVLRRDGANEPTEVGIIAATVLLWWLAMRTIDPRVQSMSRYPKLRACWLVVYCLFFPFNVALLLIAVRGLPLSVMIIGLVVMVGAVVVLAALAVPIVREKTKALRGTN
jgi:hypothetical protein